MEPDYDFTATKYDIGNSMQLVVDELLQSDNDTPEYLEGFTRAIINLNTQLLVARGLERSRILDIANDEILA